jgi:hypothetical protein
VIVPEPCLFTLVVIGYHPVLSISNVLPPEVPTHASNLITVVGEALLASMPVSVSPGRQKTMLTTKALALGPLTPPSILSRFSCLRLRLVKFLPPLHHHGISTALHGTLSDNNNLGP